MGNEPASSASSNQPQTYKDVPPTLKLIQGEIDKFYVTELTKQQFTQQLFSDI